MLDPVAAAALLVFGRRRRRELKLIALAVDFSAGTPGELAAVGVVASSSFADARLEVIGRDVASCERLALGKASLDVSFGTMRKLL